MSTQTPNVIGLQNLWSERIYEQLVDANKKLADIQSSALETNTLLKQLIDDQGPQLAGATVVVTQK